MNAASSLKTALVHHWLTTTRGGERVLEAMSELFPHADLFTLVCDPRRMSPALRGHRLRTSFLQHLPRAARWYPYYLPLFPLATHRLDLSGYRLVISSDAATVKGVRVEPGATHLCYCHTPMRYVWSGFDTYRSAGPLTRLALPPVAAWLRRWDYRAAQRVDYFAANSENVAERIRRYYGRESTVIYPPVDSARFAPASPPEGQGDYFLVVSQLVRYKRVDLAIDVFNRTGKRLLVIGEGSERGKLERGARSNISFLGSQPIEVLCQAMRSCRALVFPGEEDFGIVMAEAQACGRPVIAFARGGAGEIVTDGVSGLLFEEQTADSLLESLARFEKARFDPVAVRTSALRFTRERFLQQFSNFVDQSLGAKNALAQTQNARAQREILSSHSRPS